MKIYNYNDQGFFTSESVARPNPMEPGKFIIPAKATTIVPPTQTEGNVVVFTGTTWEVKKDNRGNWYSTETGQKQVITTYDADVNGLTKLAPVDIFQKWDGSKWITDLDKYKTAKSNEVRTKTSALILAGFTSKGKSWGMSLTDQANWSALMQVLDLITYPVYIQDITGLPVSFANKSEVQAVYMDGFTRKATLLAQDGVLEQRIQAAQSKEELDAIVDDRS